MSDQGSPEFPAPQEPAPEESAPQEGGGAIDWRKLHPITPLLNAWKAAAAIVVVGLWQFQDIDFSEFDLRPLLIVGIIAGIIVLGAIIGLIFGYLSWRRTSYAITQEAVNLHQGILFRQERHVRLDRIQAVEITQPLLARIFGYAALKVESAGGSDSNLQLAFLTQAQAHTLRAEILARAAGVKLKMTGGDSGVSDPAGQRAGSRLRQFTPELVDNAGPLEAPEQQVLSLTLGRLIGSMALSGAVVGSTILALGLVVPEFFTSGRGFTGFGAILPIIGALGYVWSRFSGEFNFRAAISPDGVRIRQGLLETRARTIPPGRVQAIRIKQGVLWRKADWWRIEVNVAGYGLETDGATSSVLYPAAKGTEVDQMVALVLPDFGTADPHGLLHESLRGTDNTNGFTTSPRRARWINPLTFRRLGFAITDTAVVFRTGRLSREVTIVPHARIQSMNITTGPIDRRLDLATVTLHSTPGPVSPTLHGLATHTALEFLAAESDRAQRARASAGPERWMESRPNYSGILPASPRAQIPSFDEIGSA